MEKLLTREYYPWPNETTITPTWTNPVLDKGVATVGTIDYPDTSWTTVNTAGTNILKHGKPTWCDKPYSCAECDRANYCVDKYNGREENETENREAKR